MSPSPIREQGGHFLSDRSQGRRRWHIWSILPRGHKAGNRAWSPNPQPVLDPSSQQMLAELCLWPPSKTSHSTQEFWVPGPNPDWSWEHPHAGDRLGWGRCSRMLPNPAIQRGPEREERQDRRARIWDWCPQGFTALLRPAPTFQPPQETTPAAKAQRRRSSPPRVTPAGRDGSCDAWAEHLLRGPEGIFEMPRSLRRGPTLFVCSAASRAEADGFGEERRR